MNYTSKKRLNSLVHRMSKRVKGLQLAHAFKLLKSNGIRLRIAEMDGEKYPRPMGDKEHDRINVQIEGGRVVRCWIG